MPDIIFPSEVLNFDGEPAGEVAALDFMHLYSIMCYPRDDAAQERFAKAIAAGRTLALIKTSKEVFGEDLRVVADADLMLSVAQAPDAIQTVEQSAKDAAFGGAVAGYVLGWTIFRSALPETRDTASLGAAFRMIEEACAKGRWRGGGVDNLKQNIWPKYRSVAHLWAALQVWNDLNAGSAWPISPNGLYHFLMMAEWLRVKGEALRPLHARPNERILNSEETWKIRPEVSRDWPPFELRCADLDAWDLRKRIKRAD